MLSSTIKISKRLLDLCAKTYLSGFGGFIGATLDYLLNGITIHDLNWDIPA
jgi:hypothetical protein